ncbi:pyridoxal phosphate-dependent aminotransferase [Candidatus Uhrbacteria bacterium]|nr:pyridoxal phosphate-dependent aminotransferase [Candidatus Uhrbacteria bacterium]
MQFSSLMNVAPSASVAMNTLALEKKTKGERVYNLAAGEPMVDTHPLVIESAAKAMRDGKTHYPPVAGIPELREASVAWMNSTYGTRYEQKNSIVTCGGKFGVFALCHALLEHGDEVLIPAPYWVSYPGMVRLFGGVPKTVSTAESNGWKLTIENLESHITQKSKLLILNNASNPTGVLYEKGELARILALAKEKNLIVISDEVYSGLVYDGKTFVSCGAFPEYQDRVLVIQSCSKHFAMTGWRVGFVFGPSEVIKTLAMLQGQSTTGTASISQWAALAAIQNAESIVPAVRNSMQGRRDVCGHAFQQAFGRSLRIPQSSLYFFVPIEMIRMNPRDSSHAAMELLEKANIATVPGAAFGQEGYLRFSFGDTPDELTAAINALSDYTKKM